MLHDQNLTVPDDGRQYVQVLWDYDIYGMSRQEANGVKGNFDFPQLANAEYGIKRVYPGFYGTPYEDVSMSDDYYHLMYKLLKWAANDRLEEGRIKYWFEKVSNRPTGRISHTEPVRQKGDGGWFAHVEPLASAQWAWNEQVMDGKSNTDAVNREYGAGDPVTGWNKKTAKVNFSWRHGFYAGSLHAIGQNFGSYWGVPCIDTTQPAPTFEHVIENGLYHWMNAVSRDRLPDGRNIVSDFPCVAEPLKALGLPKIGTPALTLGRGPMIWIKKSSCSPVLPAGTPWSPYKKLW